MTAPAFQDELSGREPHELEQYRSISGLAVCSLLFGFVSIAALAHPSAWIFPLIAITCGSIALLRIARQPDVLLGRRMALTGLALGLFFGLWATTHYATERWIVNRQARAFAEQWLQTVLDGDLESAHQATLQYYLREPEGTRLEEYYQHDPAQLKLLQDFFAEGMAKQLVDVGKDGEFRFEGTVALMKQPSSRLVRQRFFVQPRDVDQPRLHLQAELLMELREDGVYWTLLGVDDAEILDRRSPY